MMVLGDGLGGTHRDPRPHHQWMIAALLWAKVPRAVLEKLSKLIELGMVCLEIVADLIPHYPSEHSWISHWVVTID